MTSNAPGGRRILGSLRSADGKGVVRMEDRFHSGIDDVWSALTDPGRLARWIGEVDGDLRLGGEYRFRFFASGSEGTGAWRRATPHSGCWFWSRTPDAPYEEVIEATLAAEGDQTILVLEERGMPLDLLAAYGAGVQIHVEDLGAHIGGRERRDDDSRWNELLPAYQALAANVAS